MTGRNGREKQDYIYKRSEKNSWILAPPKGLIGVVVDPKAGAVAVVVAGANVEGKVVVPVMPNGLVVAVAVAGAPKGLVADEEGNPNGFAVVEGFGAALKDGVKVGNVVAAVLPNAGVVVGFVAEVPKAPNVVVGLVAAGVAVVPNGFTEVVVEGKVNPAPVFAAVVPNVDGVPNGAAPINSKDEEE